MFFALGGVRRGAVVVRLGAAGRDVTGGDAVPPPAPICAGFFAAKFAARAFDAAACCASYKGIPPRKPLICEAILSARFVNFDSAAACFPR